jgi:microbial collagenase
MYDIFSRTHDKEEAKAFYCNHNEVPWSLNEFMDRHADLLNTKNEWILRNTGGELARFLKYDCLYSQVSGYIKNQVAKYSSSSGEKVWAVMANNIDKYDSKNCAQYGVCNYKVNLEKKILPITRTCPKTYVDTFIVRAEAMSSTELDEVCTRLKAQESHFHNLVKDNWAPVVPDTNDKIEVVIFNNTEQYKFYAWLLFDIDTNNGGMYMEGDPSQAGNIARYYCFERPRGGKFDVWNLEHEFSHYLDGRYNMKGGFSDTNKDRTVWWGEGFAEYAANKENYPSMVDDCKAKRYSLSTIFNNNYESGTTRVYHYGYLAARFMFERHRNDVSTILNYFRAGKNDEYQSWFNGIVNQYDNEFSNWCTCIANKKPCP